MRLRNHKIVGINYLAAKAIGSKITPVIVVVHDTASRLTEGNAAGYLRDNPAKVSVHFVIERSGKVTQQVPTNRRANHAGKSHYHGRDSCNNFSIGIEIVNPGRMQDAGGEKARAWFKQEFDIKDANIQAITTPEHGAGLWMDYTEEQIAAVTELLQALFVQIPDLMDIVPHWYVSPGRKVDTNPLFPLSHIKSLVLGRRDLAEQDAEDGSTADLSQPLVQVVTGGSGLNLRRWPSINPNIIASIPNGTLVSSIRSGVFAGRSWRRVFYDGQEGWIDQRYTSQLPNNSISKG